MLNRFHREFLQSTAALLGSAKKNGWHLTEYPIPDQLGLDGKPLCIYRAELGAKTATKNLLITIDNHGLESAATRAIATKMMHEFGQISLPDDVAVTIVTCNPKSVLEKTRENRGVDSNRGARDKFDKLKTRDLYTRYPDAETALVPRNDLSDEGLAKAWSRIAQIRQEMGHKKFMADMMGGQDDTPNRVSYTGTQPTPEFLIVKNIMVDLLRRSKKLTHLDLHTGLGNYGEEGVIVLVDTNDRAHKVFGHKAKQLGKGSVSPPVVGALAGHWEFLIPQERERREKAGIKMPLEVLSSGHEIGTCDMDRNVQNLGRRLALSLNNDQHERASNIIEAAQNCFVPRNRQWQQIYLDKTSAYIRRAFRALAQKEGMTKVVPMRRELRRTGAPLHQPAPRKMHVTRRRQWHEAKVA